MLFYMILYEKQSHGRVIINVLKELPGLPFFKTPIYKLFQDSKI